MLSDYSGCFFDDGLGPDSADRYRQRRLQLMQSCPGIMILSGLQEDPCHSLTWYHFKPFFFQDPSVLYLTGINQCGVIVILDSERHEVDVFLPEKNKKKEFWDGVQFGAGDPKDLEALKQLSGLTRVHSLDEWWPVLQDRIESQSAQFVSTYIHKKDNGRFWKDHHYTFYKQLKRKLSHFSPGVLIQNNASSIIQKRILFDDVSVKNASYANAIAKETFQQVCETLPSLKTEHEIFGLIEGSIRAASPFGLSFQPIVAAGSNATVLHYTKNNDPIDENQLILLDFGARWHSVVSDVSRTIPKSGTFNPLQRLLYQIVLDAQYRVEAAVKPGITIAELNDICWPFILSQLDTLIIKKGGSFELPYQHAPHNVGHLIGIQVHEGDPFRGYKDIPLKADQMITNEPGLYGTFSLAIDGQLYHETCGIRIEDSLLITPNGSKNMTSMIPKDLSDIEHHIGASSPLLLH